MDEDLTPGADEAARLDAEIDAVLEGRAGPEADPGVLWLAAATRPSVPPGLAARIDALVAAAPPAPVTGVPTRAATEDAAARPGRALRAVAALLALTFAFHAGSAILFGDWISQNLGEHGTHAVYESGLAMMAAAICVGAGALYRSWSPVAVAAGSPLGVGLGLHGIPEYTVWAAGSLLHGAEGVLAIALVIAWWRDRAARHT